MDIFGYHYYDYEYYSGSVANDDDDQGEGRQLMHRASQSVCCH